MNPLPVLIAAGCAIAFYRIGHAEYKKGTLVALVSLFISVGAMFGLKWSIFSTLMAQFGLFVILTLINLRTK